MYSFHLSRRSSRGHFVLIVGHFDDRKKPNIFRFLISAYAMSNPTFRLLIFRVFPIKPCFSILHIGISGYLFSGHIVTIRILTASDPATGVDVAHDYLSECEPADGVIWNRT